MYTVKKVIKFGMLFGFKIVDEDGKAMPYEYDEDEEWRANSKCELMNALKDLKDIADSSTVKSDVKDVENVNDIVAYKNRAIDTNKPVFIYRNLKKGESKKCYSVRQNNIVVGHTGKFILKNCSFVIRQGEKSRCIENKQRNVHAFIKGFLGNTSDIGMVFSHILNYDPFTEKPFYIKVSDQEKQVFKANVAYTQDNLVLIQL